MILIRAAVAGDAKVLLRNTKTTPVVVIGVIYVSAQSGGIANQWIVSVDRAATGNNDNKLDKAEIQAFVGTQKIPEAFFTRTFGRGDLNHDGILEGRELDLAFMHPDNFAGVDFTVTGENAAEQTIWQCVAAAKETSLNRICSGSIRRSTPTILCRPSSAMDGCC